MQRQASLKSLLTDSTGSLGSSRSAFSPRGSTYKQVIKAGKNTREKHIKHEEEEMHLVYVSTRNLTTDLSSWKEKIQYHKSSGSDVETATIPTVAELNRSHLANQQRRASKFLNLYRHLDTGEYYVESYSLSGSTDAVKSTPELINESGKIRGFMYVVVMRKTEANFNSNTPQVEIRLAPFIKEGTTWTDHGGAVNTQIEAVLMSGEIYFDKKLIVANTKSHTFNNGGSNPHCMPSNALQRQIFTELFQDKFTKIDHTNFFCCNEMDEYLWKHYLEIGFYDQLTGPVLEQLTRRIISDDTLIAALHDVEIHAFEEIQIKVKEHEMFIVSILLPRKHLIDTDKTNEEINKFWQARRKELEEFKQIKTLLKNKQLEALTLKNVKELLVRIRSKDAIQIIATHDIMQIDDVENLNLKTLHDMLKLFSTRAYYGYDDFYSDILIDKTTFYLNHFQTANAAMDLEDSTVPEIQATKQGNQLVVHVDSKTAADASSVVVINPSQGFQTRYIAVPVIQTQSLNLSGSRSALLLNTNSGSSSSTFMGKSNSCNSIPNNGLIVNSDSRPTSPIQAGGSSSGGEEDTLFRDSTVSLRKAT